MEKQSLTWRERISGLRYLPSLFRMVWETSRKYTIELILLRMTLAVFPVVGLWVGKLIIDTVVDSTLSRDAKLLRIGELVAFQVVWLLLSEAVARAVSLIESLLGDLFSHLTSIKLMEHAATLDLHQFEDPKFYDQLNRARHETVGRVQLLAHVVNMGQDMLTLLSLSGALFVYSPWLLLLLVVAVLPGFWGETRFAALKYSLTCKHTPERRLLDYIRQLAASDHSIKEVQIFRLSPWLISRYRALANKFYAENRSLSIRKSVASTALSAIGTFGYFGAYLHVLFSAVAGLITIGTLTFLSASFARSRDLIQRLISSASDVFEQCLYLRDLFSFFDMKPSIVSTAGAPEVPNPMLDGFVFEDVGFKYPDSERWALRHVNFALRPHERVAFVGENGAGKTTLVKLLARLYDPTEGRILLDGRDLRTYDLPSVRRAVGVIFQDFVRYDMRLDENIGVGEISKVESSLVVTENEYSVDGVRPSENEVVHDAIIQAAQRSHAVSFLPRLPHGYKQLLGRRFDGGINLSGGEWQKIALARAYIRDAQILILDEPTAALDARAEYEVYKRFSELLEGRMAVIISHRFSTVRIADRLIVLENGSVAENGPHMDLVARGGPYAQLFQLQAEAYR